MLQIMAKVGMDGRGFRAGIMGIESMVKGFSRRTAGYFAGMFTVGAAVQLGRRVLENAAKISDMSKSLGISVERFQELQYIADQTGTSVDAIAASYVKIAKAQKEALADPTGEMAAAFKDIGIKDLKKPADEMATLISRGAETGQIGFNKMASLTKIMGRSAREVLQAYQGGFETLAKQAREANVIIGEADVQQAADLEDKFSEMQAQIIAFATRGLPIMVAAIDKIAEAFGALIAFIKQFYTEFSKPIETEKRLAGYDFAGKPQYSEFPKEGYSFGSIWERAWKEGMKGLETFAEKRVATEAYQQEAKALKDAITRRNLLTQQSLIMQDLEDTQEKEKKAKEFKMPSDELARIGGFVGGVGRNRGIEIAEKQLKRLDSIEDYVRRVVFGVL